MYRERGLSANVIYAWHTVNTRRMARIAKDVAYWHVWGYRANDVLRDVGRASPAWRQDRALRRLRPKVEDAAFIALLFDVPRNGEWIGMRVYHKPKDRSAGPVYDLLDSRYQHCEIACILTQPVPPTTIRVWATLWTQSAWDRCDGWRTDVRIRRAV